MYVVNLKQLKNNTIIFKMRMNPTRLLFIYKFNSNDPIAYLLLV